MTFHISGTTNNSWDKRIPFEPLWEQYKRITKPNAAIVLFSQVPFGSDLIQSNKKMFRYEWIWYKSLSVGFLNAHKMPLRRHENILVFYRKLPTYNPQKWKSKPYSKPNSTKVTTSYGVKESIARKYDEWRMPIDVIEFNTAATHTNHYSLHPTQKPIDLLEYLIKTYTNEGELVLDNCIGSGSTAVAAVNTNRDFIGFETDAGYCEIAERRITEAQAAKEMRLAL